MSKKLTSLDVKDYWFILGSEFSMFAKFFNLLKKRNEQDKEIEELCRLKLGHFEEAIDLCDSFASRDEKSEKNLREIKFFLKEIKHYFSVADNFKMMSMQRRLVSKKEIKSVETISDLIKAS